MVQIPAESNVFLPVCRSGGIRKTLVGWYFFLVILVSSIIMFLLLPSCSWCSGFWSFSSPHLLTLVDSVSLSFVLLIFLFLIVNSCCWQWFWLPVDLRRSSFLFLWFSSSLYISLIVNSGCLHCFWLSKLFFIMVKERSTSCSSL